jgi:hypothetical protein
MTGKMLLLTLLGGMFVLVGSCVAFANVKTNPTRAFSLLDGLAIPPSWQLAHTATSPSLIFYSWAARYYLVDAEPEQATEAARVLLTTAGWPVETGAWKDCTTNGPTGPMSCWLRADLGRNILMVSVWDRDRGLESDYGAGDNDFRVANPTRLVVRVLIHY